jgi:hypothetical protein
VAVDTPVTSNLIHSADYQRGCRRKTQKLDLDIRTAFASGGRVFVADHVFWSESYRDLGQTADPFAEYARAEFAGVNGEGLGSEIKSFFGRYKLIESGFKIAADRFWELKRIE